MAATAPVRMRPAEVEGLPRLTSKTGAKSAHALVTREIALHILRGDYPPESMLPGESELMKEFQVSRTALREALKTLAAKGLIVSKTKIGTKVQPSSLWNMYDPQVLTWRVDVGVDSDFLGQLYEVRQALEPAGSAMAAQRRTPEQLGRMRHYLEGMNQLNHTRQTYAESDLRFHQEILMATGNPFMQAFSTIIEASIFCAFQISAPIETPDRFHLSIARHRRVLDAIDAGDPMAASQAMSAVIVEGMENANFNLAKAPIKIMLPLQIGMGGQAPALG